MVICWDIYCPKMAAFQKTKLKKKKENILQELANKNSIKCLSHCYCGMSMGFSCCRGGRDDSVAGGEATSIWTTPTLANLVHDR